MLFSFKSYWCLSTVFWVSFVMLIILIFHIWHLYSVIWSYVVLACHMEWHCSTIFFFLSPHKCPTTPLFSMLCLFFEFPVSFLHHPVHELLSRSSSLPLHPSVWQWLGYWRFWIDGLERMLYIGAVVTINNMWRPLTLKEYVLFQSGLHLVYFCVWFSQ